MASIYDSMKTRRIILWVGVVILVVIAMLAWFAKKQAEVSAPTVAETNAAPAPSPGHTVAESGQNAPVTTERTDAPDTNISARTTPQPRPNDARLGLAGLNDVPIVFDGRLEDQFGSPVVGADIAASVRIYNGSRSTVERFSVTSDANGLFHIDYGKGEALGLVPSKEGYVLAAPSTYFKYSYMYPDRYAPDPNNPTVIKMWKLQGAEPLVDIGQSYKIHYTNTPLYFDLVARSGF